MKKNLLFIILLAGAAMFGLGSCTKEISDNFTTYPNSPLNDTVWVRGFSSTMAINDLFDLLVPGGVQVDSFPVTAGGTVRFGDSIEATFPAASCLTPTGAPPTGNAVVQLLQLRTKGDYIKFFKPTGAANDYMLETGGAVYMRVVKDGKELILAPNATVKVRFATDTVRQDMQAFYGRESNPLPGRWIDTAFLWQRDSDTTHLATWTKSNYKGYEINAKNLRWIAAEKYSDSTLAKIKVTAILSPNFTNKNTAVFAVLANQRTVINLHGDYPSRSFFANNIPLKSAVTLVSLSKIGDDLYLGVENIASLAAATSHTIKPQRKSLAEILTYLNGL